MSDKIDKLRRATLVQDTRGWRSGALESGPNGQVCLNGALARALYPDRAVLASDIYTDSGVNELAAELVETARQDGIYVPTAPTSARQVIHLNDIVAKSRGGKAFALELLRKTILRLKRENGS